MILEAIGEDGRVTEGAGADSSDNARLLVLLQASVGETDARRATRAAREAEYMSQPRQTADFSSGCGSTQAMKRQCYVLYLGTQGCLAGPKISGQIRWRLGCLAAWGVLLRPSAQHPERERKT